MGLGPYASSVERFPRLRQSTLAAFDRCALSTHFEQEYMKDWSSAPQSRGTIFHRFAAEVLKELHRQQVSTIPTSEAVEIMSETLRQKDVDSHCGMCHAPAEYRPSPPAEDGTYVPGRVYCANGHSHSSNFINIPAQEISDLRWVAVKFANDNEFDIANLVDIEQRLMHSINYPDPDGLPVERTLTGQLDALFIVGDAADHAIVLDWKDTWALPAPTEIGFDGYFQQRFYAWLVMHNYPTVNRVTLREMYVRKSETREADVWRGQDLPDIEGEIAALAERFDRAFFEGNFPATPGKHCSMCPLPARCPIFRGVRTEGVIENEQEAMIFARQLLVGKAAVKHRDQELKAWSDKHGPVPISSHKGPRQLGYVDRQRTSRPSQKQLEQAIADAGGGPIDPTTLYRTSGVTVFTDHTPPPGASEEEEALDEKLSAALQQSLDEREGR